jgi:hypothetical protein
VHRQVAFLKDRALPDSELLTALTALPQAVALNTFGVFLACLGADAFQVEGAINNAAMRSNRSIGRNASFNVRENCGFVEHIEGRENEQTAFL